MRIRKAKDSLGQLAQPTIIDSAPDLASLIQRMYGLVSRSMKELEETDKLGPRQVSSLVSLAKTLPLLEQAELARSVKINNKALKDLSTKELKRLAGKILRPEATPEAEADDEGEA